MKLSMLIAAMVGVVCLGSVVQANVFDMGPGRTSLQTVIVGDPGNTGELSGAGAGGYGSDAICGDVGYSYRIGTYEVTSSQYAEFLNAVAKSDPNGLYNASMASSPGCGIIRGGSNGNYIYTVVSGYNNRPVNYVSFWDSLRFANWLYNGQPTGKQGLSTTEDGSYYLNGRNGCGGSDIARKPGATWVIPSEDEWYKAAYYKGGGTNAGYWDYPTQSNSIPNNQLVNTDLGNNANYYKYPNYTSGSPFHQTVVGDFENSGSAYSTFDQGGNVCEWTDTLNPGMYAKRIVRGGSYISDSLEMQSNIRLDNYPYAEDSALGFRVAVVVPEPASVICLLSGLGLVIGSRRRRK